MHPAPGRARKSRLTLGLACLFALPTPLRAAQPGPEPRAADPRSIASAAAELRETIARIQQIPGAAPAFAAVIVQGEETPLLYAHGALRAGEPAQADAHSRFYIASQTKSFIGLLAAQLDETGVLPLGTTLTEVWPQLRLPAPADAARITLSDLLSHQEPLRTDTLNFLTAYVRAVPAADYPAMLSRYTEAREPGFRYSNLGDLIYGAALETRTGKSWQDWLQQEVLQPLQLDEVNARSSQVPAAQLTWNHRWDGNSWIAGAAKPDTLMHAAGGLLASPNALALWMRANLQQRSPTGLPSAHAFQRAQQALVKADLSDGEFVCDAYSLGWYRCAYKQQQVLMHPGGYPGVVSATVLIPALGAGLSLVATSDSAMEGLQLELMKAFIGLASGQHGEVERLRKAVADYPARLARTVASRQDKVAKARAEASWGGWTWAPADTTRYLGHFRSERLGELQVVQTSDGLEARLGELPLRLQPASPNLFGATRSALDAPEAFRYAEDAQSLRWNEDEFTRLY